jgi:hypothetical protein
VNDLFGPTSSAPVVGLNAGMPSPCRQCGGVDTTDQHHLAVTRIANRSAKIPATEELSRSETTVCAARARESASKQRD